MNKYRRDGEVAVLVSKGYGAGWFTWNLNDPQLLFDPVIVGLVMNDENYNEYGMSISQETQKAVIKYVEEQYDNVYTGGVDGLTVKWVPEGQQFRVEEYDGAESLVFPDNEKWLVA